MATTSTVPTVIDALLAAFNIENYPEEYQATYGGLAGVMTHEAWPGPDASAEMVVLGEVTWDEYRIATIKSGRKQRQENYAVGFEVFIMGAPGSKPTDPSTARDRALEVLAAIEDVLADDPTIGLAAGTVQRIELEPTEAGPRVFEKGWAYRIAGRFNVHARLQ